MPSPHAPNTPLPARVADRRAAVFIGLAAAVAAGLRLHALTGQSLWIDEGFSVWMGRVSWPEWWGYMLRENHPPLYYLLLRAWMAAFGQSDIAVRLLSVAVGVPAVLFTALAAGRIGGPRAAVLAAWLAAMAPQLARYSQEARMYSLSVLLASLAVWAGAGWMRTRDARSGRLYVAAVSLALYTHYYGALLWAGLAASGLLYLVGEERASGSLKRWALLNAMPALLFAPWLPVFREQLAANWNTHWLVSLPEEPGFAPLAFLGWSLGIFTGSERASAGVPGPFTAVWLTAWAACLAWCLFITRGWRADGPARESAGAAHGGFWLAVGSGVMPVLIAWAVSGVHNIWQPKYLLVCMPGLICALAAVLARLRSRLAVCAVAAALMAQCWVASTRLVGTVGPDTLEQWREATGYVRRNMQPRDLVLVPEPICLPPFLPCVVHYGIPESACADLPGALEAPDGRARLRALCAGRPRVWLVTRERVEGDVPQALAGLGFHEAGNRGRWVRVNVALFVRQTGSPTERVPKHGMAADHEEAKR